ncbi:MAG: hypothetical protein JXL97_09305 [Bacteroidales bacterium]|nr:hypothetical protein [Bacteroidales bacterium]
MREYRFIGLDSFTEQDKEIFFERDSVVEQIFKTSFFENITVVHANTGAGKTSLLKAGLLPKLKQNNEYEPFLVKIDNFINNTERSLLDLITEKVKKNYPKNSFLDKILTPDDSLWYLFKRIESTENKVVFLIIDQFENIFSYPESQRLQIKNELYELIYEQIPVRFRAEVNEFLTENPNILTEKGIKKLYEKINIRLIISIRQDKLNMLDFFNDKIHKISENKVEIPQLTIEQASTILKKTSSFVPKYNIDDKFVSQPFIVSHKLTEEIIEFLTKNNSKKIEAYQVQIIGAELEKIATENKSKVVDSSLISEISIIYKSYYESIIEKIQNSRQEISARKFIENELIFEYENRKLTIYEGLAKQKYELEDSTIDFLIENQLIVATQNENHDRYLELSHDALITPVLLAKEKRIHHEIRVEEELKKKKELENAKKLQEEKTIRNRKIAIVFSVLFVFALALGIFAFWQRNNAIKSEKIANSTMYASYSFHFLETNPTLGYRLAEQSYSIDNENIIAQKAFFCSFYKTNVFYQNLAEFGYDIDKAIFSTNGEMLLLITDKNYIIISKSGRKIHESSKDRVYRLLLLPIINI